MPNHAPEDNLGSRNEAMTNIMPIKTADELTLSRLTELE